MIKDSSWHDLKRQRCIDNYSSKTKMRSVEDWRKRIMQSGRSQKAIADAVGIQSPRLSEYMRLLVEPSDYKFYLIEAAINNANKK